MSRPRRGRVLALAALVAGLLGTLAPSALASHTAVISENYQGMSGTGQATYDSQVFTVQPSWGLRGYVSFTSTSATSVGWVCGASDRYPRAFVSATGTLGQNHADMPRMVLSYTSTSAMTLKGPYSISRTCRLTVESTDRAGFEFTLWQGQAFHYYNHPPDEGGPPVLTPPPGPGGTPHPTYAPTPANTNPPTPTPEPSHDYCGVTVVGPTPPPGHPLASCAPSPSPTSTPCTVSVPPDFIGPAAPCSSSSPSPTPSASPSPDTNECPSVTGTTGTGSFIFDVRAPYNGVCVIWQGYNVAATDIAVSVSGVMFYGENVGAGNVKGEYRRVSLQSTGSTCDPNGAWAGGTSVNRFTSAVPQSGPWSGSQTTTSNTRAYCYWRLVVYSDGGLENEDAQDGTLHATGSFTITGAETDPNEPTPTPSGGPTPTPSGGPSPSPSPSGGPQDPGDGGQGDCVMPISQEHKEACIPMQQFAVCQEVWPSTNDLDYLNKIDCEMRNLQVAITNGANGTVNAMSDMLIPGEDFGDALGGVGTLLEGKAPLGYVGQVSGALGDGLGGIGGDGLTFCINWKAEACIDPYDITAPVVPFRGALAGLSALLLAWAIYRRVTGTLGGQASPS